MSLSVVLVKLAVLLPLPTPENRVIVLPEGEVSLTVRSGSLGIGDVERDGQAGQGLARCRPGSRSCRARRAATSGCRSGPDGMAVPTGTAVAA